MKESHRKGIASHPDPESCVAGREAAIEALTGAHAGRVLSPENREPERRRCQAKRKATRTEWNLSRLRGVIDPTHAWNSMQGNQEVPVLPAAVRKRRAGGGTHKGHLLMHGAGKSDCRVVPEKAPNKGIPRRGGNLRRGGREGGGLRRTQ